jgi:pimeloyl-ACP methyl ester carboxylesterase
MNELQLQVPGLTLAAVEFGDARAEHKVLALHGWLDNAATFATLAPLLDDLHIVAVDLPGHGKSEHRSVNDTYHFIDWIPEVVAVCEALGWQKPTLMGHSMGAAIASITAGTVPDLARSVVLLDGIAPYTTPASDAPETLQKFVKQRGRLLGKKRPLYASVDEATERLIEVTTLEKAAARLLTERNVRSEPGGVAWTYDPRLRYISPMRFTDEHNLAFLKRIVAPVLLVRPDKGLPIEPSVFASWTSVIARLQIERPAGGHHLHLEHPERVAPFVSAFLSQV